MGAEWGKYGGGRGSWGREEFARCTSTEREEEIGDQIGYWGLLSWERSTDV